MKNDEYQMLITILLKDICQRKIQEENNGSFFNTKKVSFIVKFPADNKI